MTDKATADLRRQIERTRQQLGQTVEELAAKADVRGRTRARAADLRDRAGAMSVQLRSSAAEAGRHVQERANRAGHATQERASRAGHTVQESAVRAGHTAQERTVQARHELRGKASDVGRTAESRAPAALRAPVGFARRHPWPLVVAGAAAVTLVVAGMRARAAGRGAPGAERWKC